MFYKSSDFGITQTAKYAPRARTSCQRRKCRGDAFKVIAHMDERFDMCSSLVMFKQTRKSRARTGPVQLIYYLLRPLFELCQHLLIRGFESIY